MNEIAVDAFRILISGVVMGVGAISWWGIRRLVHGQDLLNETLREISDQISETFVRVGQLETWVKQRERLDDQRHADNTRAMRDVWQELRKHN